MIADVIADLPFILIPIVVVVGGILLTIAVLYCMPAINRALDHNKQRRPPTAY